MFQVSFTIGVPKERIDDREWQRMAQPWLKDRFADHFQTITVEEIKPGSLMFEGMCQHSFHRVAEMIQLVASHGSLVLDGEKFSIGQVTIVDLVTRTTIVDHVSPMLVYDDVAHALYRLYMMGRETRRELMIAH